MASTCEALSCSEGLAVLKDAIWRCWQKDVFDLQFLQLNNSTGGGSVVDRPVYRQRVKVSPN